MKATLKFVQRRLRSIPNWLLIYDNVKNFLQVKDYLPQDPNLWGKGKVIITTRDSEINKDNSSQILIDELSYQEALELFCKIIYNTKPELLSSSEQKRVSEFLINLSPFPLDIMAAACYIKDTNISYQEYLQAIISTTNNFDIMRSLKEVCDSDYDQSRYSIVALSLKKILGINPDFKELLFFICLIDPQDIPKDLLLLCKDSHLVNDFIQQLQKYALLIDGTDSVSMHHSIHGMCKAYIKTQTISESATVSFGNALEKYLNDQVDKISNTSLSRLARHGEAFLKAELPLDTTSTIELVMGRIYYELNEITKAQRLLEHSLVNCSNHNRSGKAATQLGLLYYYKHGDFKLGKKYLEKAIKFYSEDQSTNLELARSVSYLGRLLLDANQYAEAKGKLEQSITLLSKESEVSVALAHAKLYLGVLYSDLADYDKAFKLFDQSLELYKILNIERDIGWVLHYRGISEAERKNYKESITLLKHSGKIFKKNYTKNHLSLWWHYLYLANLYRDMGDYAEAKKYYEKSKQIYESCNSDNKAKLGLFLQHIGKFYAMTGDYTLAKKSLEQSKDLYATVYGENSIKIASILIDLGRLNIDLGNYDQASNMLKSGLSLFKQQLNDNNPNIKEVLTDLEIVNKYLNTKTKLL